MLVRIVLGGRKGKFDRRVFNMRLKKNSDDDNTVPSSQLVLGNLKEELFDLLECDFNALAGDCSLSQLLTIKQFCHDEQRRVSNWGQLLPKHPTVPNGLQKFQDDEKARVADWELSASNPIRAAFHLVENLNGARPDKEAAIKWLGEYQEKITVELLMYIVTESRIRGVVEMMGANGRNKRRVTDKKMQEVGRLWKEVSKEAAAKGKKPTKIAAAEKIAEKVGLTREHVYNLLTEKKYRARVFPSAESE